MGLLLSDTHPKALAFGIARAHASHAMHSAVPLGHGDSACGDAIENDKRNDMMPRPAIRDVRAITAPHLSLLVVWAHLRSAWEEWKLGTSIKQPSRGTN